MSQPLTRMKKNLVENAIKKTKSHEPQILCDYICEFLVNRYSCERSLNIALTKMKIETTKDIYDIIECYFNENNKAKLPERKYTIWS